MSNTATPTSPDCSLQASYYADRARFSTAEILENERVATQTYRLRIAVPEIAQSIVPGQFVMLRLAGVDDPMLGRAFALYDVIRDEPIGKGAGQATAIDIVYLVHGKLTTALATRQPGDQVELWGPLGNGFAASTDDKSFDHLICVAGGIGHTPFLALGKEALGTATYGEHAPILASKTTLCYGVRTAELLAGEKDFQEAGFDVRLASDDGTVGHHGFVTDLLRQTLDESANQKVLVACCGPEPMMAAIAELCLDRQIQCLVSLETPMACGIGICFSCVARVAQVGPDGETEWDYKRTCVEGPIFDATKIVW